MADKATPTRKGKRIALTAGLVVAALAVGAGWLYRDDIAAWYEFRQLFESLDLNAQGYPEYRHRRTGIVFVSLPGGKFLMGSPEDEEVRIVFEGPRHEVKLSPFLIAKFEVTQSEWRRVMGTGPSWPKGDDLPVNSVSWDECQEFCRKTGLRLPTEAQWEYACRGMRTTAFCFGDDASRLGEYAWYTENSGDKVHPIGTRAPNGFGLHDMHGNVLEWCEDVFDREFYSKPEATTTDPVCNLSGEDRVVRGGGFWLVPQICRSAYRSRSLPLVHLSGVLSTGFRPAWPPQ